MFLEHSKAVIKAFCHVIYCFAQSFDIVLCVLAELLKTGVFALLKRLLMLCLQFLLTVHKIQCIFGTVIDIIFNLILHKDYLVFKLLCICFF